VLCGEVLCRVLLGLEKEVLKMEQLPSLQLSYPLGNNEECGSFGGLPIPCRAALGMAEPDYKSKGI